MRLVSVNESADVLLMQCLISLFWMLSEEEEAPCQTLKITSLSSYKQPRKKKRCMMDHDKSRDSMFLNIFGLTGVNTGRRLQILLVMVLPEFTFPYL